MPIRGSFRKAPNSEGRDELEALKWAVLIAAFPLLHLPFPSSLSQFQLEHVQGIGDQGRTPLSPWFPRCSAGWLLTLCQFGLVLFGKVFCGHLEALGSREGSALQKAWWAAQFIQGGGVVLGLACLVLHHCPFPASSLCPLPPSSRAPAARRCRRSLAVPAAQFPPLTVIRLVHPETLLQVLGSDFGVQDLLPHRTGEPAPLLIMQTLPKDPA